MGLYRGKIGAPPKEVEGLLKRQCGKKGPANQAHSDPLAATSTRALEKRFPPTRKSRIHYAKSLIRSGFPILPKKRDCRSRGGALTSVCWRPTSATFTDIGVNDGSVGDKGFEK